MNKILVQNGEEGLECEVFVDGMRLSVCQNLNTWGVFLMNQVHMKQSVVGR